MASNRAKEEQAEAAPVSEATPAGEIDEILRRLEAIRGTQQTTLPDDVVPLLVQPEAPDEPPLQRRVRAIQVELTLRRQALTLEEWRSRVLAAEAEAERQRQLFSRLEAAFAQRAARQDRKAAEAGALRAERDAALARLKTAIDEKIEFERRAGDKARDFGMASELAETRRQLAETLEQDLARSRRELGDAQRDLAAARQELHDTHQFLTQTRLELTEARHGREAAQQEPARLREELRRREEALTEAERRIEELRSSRWRQLGLAIGLAKRATFEK